MGGLYSGGRRLRSDHVLTEVFTVTRHELNLIATSYFQQSGHDSQYRIFKFFALAERPGIDEKEANSKAVNGGPERPTTGGYTDNPKLAGAKLEKMTTV